jgi:hypothetical protein
MADLEREAEPLGVANRPRASGCEARPPFFAVRVPSSCELLALPTEVTARHPIGARNDR